MILELDDDTDTFECPYCGSPKKRDGCSTHCWDVEYECGCTLVGALGTDGIEVYKLCGGLIVG